MGKDDFHRLRLLPLWLLILLFSVILLKSASPEIIVHNMPIPLLTNSSQLQKPVDPADLYPKFTTEIPTEKQLRAALEHQLAIHRCDKVLIETVSPAMITKMIFVYGAETQFACRVTSERGNTTEPSYAVGLLCWNIPAAGKKILSGSSAGIMPRVGYGYQRCGGEFLAALASAEITDDYEVQTGGVGRWTIADIVESEKKLAVLHGAQAWRSAALAFYVRDIHQSWTAIDGTQISLLKLAQYELNRPVLWHRSESVERLYALTLLRNRFVQEINAGDTDPEVASLVEKIDHFFGMIRPWALSLANSENGLWVGHYLAKAQHEAVPLQALMSSAVILRWLILSATTQEDFDALHSGEMRRTIWNLALLLVNTIPPETPYSQLSEFDAAALSATLQVFSLYLAELP